MQLTNGQKAKYANRSMFRSMNLILFIVAVSLAQNNILAYAQTALLPEESKAVWIDVRSWGEYQLDHIDGDVRIHHSEIVQGVSESYPDKTTPIRLYCAVGGRAEKALKSLELAGYTDIKNMGGVEQVRKLRDR
jgi:phage shock protein E